MLISVNNYFFPKENNFRPEFILNLCRILIFKNIRIEVQCHFIWVNFLKPIL